MCASALNQRAVALSNPGGGFDCVVKVEPGVQCSRKCTFDVRVCLCAYVLPCVPACVFVYVFVQICGGVCQLRGKQDRVALWTRDAADQDKYNPIGV